MLGEENYVSTSTDDIVISACTVENSNTGARGIL